MSTNDHTWDPPWTIINTLKWTSAFLKRHDVENPRASAEVLLSHSLKCKRIDLYLRHDQPLQQEELAQFRKLLKRRVAGEPVAYIVGHKEFWSLNFKVNASVLIPRPETECLVETALRFFHLRSDVKVLELGCGSGAISVALAHERPGWRFWAVDRSVGAIMVANENAGRHRVDPHIYFLVSDWLAALGNIQFDLIVTNPPYIRTKDIDSLEPGIRAYEPRLALDGGKDGLRPLTQILQSASRHLSPGGVLMAEIGSDQRPAVSKIVHGCEEYRCVDFRKDYSGLDRVAIVTPSASWEE